LKVVDYVLKIAQGPGEAVDPGNHQGVAVAQELEEHRQFLAPLGGSAGHLLGPDHVAAGRRQR
jgi:hypothetical protein